MPDVIAGPRCNRRVTCSASPTNDRSESTLAVNPLDPYNMVGSSKRFTNPATYAFSLAAYATFDGGLSWTEAPPLGLIGDPDPTKAWVGVSDPAVAWDNAGNVFLVGLPFPATGPETLGIAIYKSTDGGRSFGAPNFIHQSTGDDKQSAAGDGNPASPFYGNVYAAWDDGSTLRFARTSDHGTTWKGVGANPVGAGFDGVVSDSFAPELAVARDGTVYIVWVNGEEFGTIVKFVKSTDGGATFSAPQVVATGISPLKSPPLPHGSFPQLPGGTFRVLTLPTVCCGSGNNVVVAWADLRESVSRIYYRNSSNGGSTWAGPASGQPLLTGAVVSGSQMHDFHPQLASTPAGVIGCAFYEFGPTGGGEFPSQLINVFLAASIDNGASFPNRALVTDRPWDPTVDAPLSHGDPTTTFIGEYFGLGASRLGFFPFWTDTRTGVQEIFMSRLAVRPADIYIRDYTGDTGDVTSMANPNSWEAPDLVVRQQPDGDVNFVDQDLLRDGVTDHYVYGRITNRGTNTAHNVRLAVTVGNYPSLIGLPGAEFRYPQDWYPNDWNTAALRNRHIFLGESAPTDLAPGATKILAPITWPAAQIPDHATWHPCLLAEARADNDDSAGGTNGCDIQVDPGTCNYGAYFWGNNNICQRNLSYAVVPALSVISLELPFVVGSVFSTAKFLDVVVDKGQELAYTPMMLRMEKIEPPDCKPEPECKPGEIVFTDKCRVIVRVGDCEAGEIVTTAGTVWLPHCPKLPAPKDPPPTCHGGEQVGESFRLDQPTSAVSFPIEAGGLRKMILSFTTPATLKHGSKPLIRITQRNDRRIIAGTVALELLVTGDGRHHGGESPKPPKPGKLPRGK